MTEDEGDARVQAAYGYGLFARLRETKARLILQICSTAPRTSRHDLATQKHMSADICGATRDVRFGALVLCAATGHVRFAPESGHVQRTRTSAECQ